MARVNAPSRLGPAGHARLWAALLAAGLAGCGDGLSIRFADHAPYQRDQVTTRSVPASSDLAARLAGDGWRVDAPEGEAPRLRLLRDRGRLWFFSAGGGATAVELYRASPEPPGAAADGPADSIHYRLNDRPGRGATWPRSREVQRLAFRPGAVRAGWNALDLFVRGKKERAAGGVLELKGFRIVEEPEGGPADGGSGDEGPRALEVDDGELSMPGESYLDLALEVPAGARLRGRATSAAARADQGPHRVSVRLLDRQGAERELSAFALAPGASERLDVDLAPWAGQAAALRISVSGPRSGAVRWRRAGITGAGERRSAEAPIPPAGVTLSGRLGRPDVVIIVLDAARADAFGAYGAAHPTPAVDALAASGTRFERAQAPSSWTGQSIPALLAGFHPDTLGTERWGDPLPNQVPHVAELMAAGGYRTVLWSQHPIYNRAESLVRGFEQVRYSGRRKRTLFPSRSFLFERHRPTFALIHLLPPHSPYAPPKPFRGAYSSGYRGKLPERLGALTRIGRTRLLELTAADHAYLFDRYLENVAFADWLVGRVVDNLERSGRYREALIVVTSDHGEAFFEHGWFMHSRELYQEFLRIPMIVKWPEGVGGFAPVVRDPATLIDLVPTLVDGLALEGAGRGFQGASLLPAVFDGQPLERPLYATTRGIGDIDKLAMPRSMFEEGGWRVIHDPVTARAELYAVAGDPDESEDLAAAQPALARLLLQRLRIQQWFNQGLLQLGPRAEVELDPEQVKELKALGYL